MADFPLRRTVAYVTCAWPDRESFIADVVERKVVLAFRGQNSSSKSILCMSAAWAADMRKRNKRSPCRKIVLKLPDLDHAKSAVLNNLSSPHSRRNYKFAMEQFISWYCSEPRLALNRTVVLRFRLYLEFLGDPPVATMSAAASRQALYGSCADEVAAWAIARQRPQPIRPFVTPVSIPAGALDGIDRYFVVCTRDRAIPLPLQRRMIAEKVCDDVVELDSDHTPHLSMTKELAGAPHQFAAHSSTNGKKVRARHIM